MKPETSASHQIIPASPGFWVHIPTVIPYGDEPVSPGDRLAVLAWMITMQPPRRRGDDPFPWVQPVTLEGTIANEYFVEQPDGSCAHNDFNTGTVADAYEKLREEVIRENAQEKARAEAAAVSQTPTIPT